MTMTRAEGLEIDRLAKGGSVPSTHSCARPGCHHSHLHHKRRTKGRPCELCGCPGLIPFREAGKLMEDVAVKPVVFKRTWVYVYSRPEEGWPLLLRKGWPEGNRKDAMFTAHDLRITVYQGEGAEPELDGIRANGVWPNGNPVRMMTVHHDAAPEHCLIAHAPDWVMDLAADAVRRSKGETCPGT